LRLETDRRTGFHLPLLSFAVANGFRGRTRFISTRRLRHRCLHPRWRFVCRCMGAPVYPVRTPTGPPLSPTKRSRPGGRIRPGRRAAAGSPPSHAIDLRTIDLRCAALLDEPRPWPGTPHQNPPAGTRLPQTGDRHGNRLSRSPGHGNVDTPRTKVGVLQALLVLHPRS
jgi:hypothetical protein